MSYHHTEGQQLWQETQTRLQGSFTHLHGFFFLDYLASRLHLAWYLYHCRLWRFFCLVSLSSNVLCLMIGVQCLIRLDQHVSAFENHTTHDV